MRRNRNIRPGTGTWLHLIFRVALSTAVLLVCSCEGPVEPEPDGPVLPPLPEDPYAIFQDLPSDEAAGWMALTANKYDENEEQIFSRVYLIDYNDPTIYKDISAINEAWYESEEGFEYPFTAPSFFPDRSKVLYMDYHYKRFLVYDVETDTTVYVSPRPIEAARSVVFSPDQKGFYFGSYNYWLGYDLAFHRFSDQSTELLTTPSLYRFSDAPVGMIGNDTLIVQTEDTILTGDWPGLYYMNRQGEILARIENPYLDTFLEDDTARGDFTWHATWNEELRLFAVQKEQPGYRSRSRKHIYVTDLDGTYFHQFTSGPYTDQIPKWGPGGGVLLFIRKDEDESNFNSYKVMKLDLKTGEVSLFVNPAVIDGATELIYPHY